MTTGTITITFKSDVNPLVARSILMAMLVNLNDHELIHDAKLEDVTDKKVNQTLK